MLLWFLQFFSKINAFLGIYEVCLKRIRYCAHCMKNFYCREKSIAFYDVTMSYDFENQISAFCDNYILFARFSVKALSL